MPRSWAEQDPAAPPATRREGRHPCACNCRCGASATQSERLCWPCTRGLHHACGRWCGAYDAMDVKDARGRYMGKTLAIPSRRPCAGGRA